MPFDPLDAYNRGLEGARANPRSDEEFVDSIIRRGGDPDGANVAHEWEFADAGRGKLTLLFPTVEAVYPGCWPGPSQLTGDCVARACADAVLYTLATEAYSARPDEVTGIVEGAVEIPTKGIAHRVVASESLWAFRGYDGDGWVCSAAAKVATEKGFLVRQPYPALKIDLTEYTEDTIRIGGSRSPGKEWLAESTQHVARTATVLKGREQVRDFLAAGFGVFSCSSLGFERVRNEDGVSRQTTIWQHAQTKIGYDDRPETVRKYGQALVLWNNQWGRWNSGPRTIMGTDIQIPEGSYWALASTLDKCQLIALSSVVGWPRRRLLTYGATGNI